MPLIFLHYRNKLKRKKTLNVGWIDKNIKSASPNPPSTANSQREGLYVLSHREKKGDIQSSRTYGWRLVPILTTAKEYVWSSLQTLVLMPPAADLWWRGPWSRPLTSCPPPAWGWPSWDCWQDGGQRSAPPASHRALLQQPRPGGQRSPTAQAKSNPSYPHPLWEDRYCKSSIPVTDPESPVLSHGYVHDLIAWCKVRYKVSGAQRPRPVSELNCRLKSVRSRLGSSVFGIGSWVQCPESDVLIPMSWVRCPLSIVQSPESNVQCTESNVHCPKSSTTAF